LERRGILLVGPTGFFLRYIEDVLPSLGEQGVRMTTLEQILPGLPTTHEPMAVARLKGEARMADVLAGARREDGPVTTLLALLASPRRLARAGAGILSAEELALLTRATWRGWTADDLPLLDELADLHPRSRRPRRGLDDEQRWAVERVVEEMASQQAMDPTMREDLVNRLSQSRLDLEEDDDEEERAIYGHVVVDEAQDLSPMQWRMLRRRCPSGSMTVVGDLAQATGAWSHESWEDAVAALGRPATVAELTVSYRTPEEIMAFADRIRPPGLQPARSAPPARHPTCGPSIATRYRRRSGKR
jgi:DNA helicase IV